jgi:hypothetical protein
MKKQVVYLIFLVVSLALLFSCGDTKVVTKEVIKEVKVPVDPAPVGKAYVVKSLDILLDDGAEIADNSCLKPDEVYIVEIDFEGEANSPVKDFVVLINNKEEKLTVNSSGKKRINAILPDGLNIVKISDSNLSDSLRIESEPTFELVQ